MNQAESIYLRGSAKETLHVFNIQDSMCIASFVQTDTKTIITFSRDEDPARPFTEPSALEDNNIFCPLDRVSGGSWIGSNPDIVACLQNGGKTAHRRELPYDRSRGLVLLELLRGRRAETLMDELLTLKIEPFTLSVYLIHEKRLVLYYFDGTQWDKEEIDLSMPRVQCSTTLYRPGVSAQIRGDFSALPELNESSLLGFHRDHRIGGPGNPFISQPATVCIAQVVCENGSLRWHFENLLSGGISDQRIEYGRG